VTLKNSFHGRTLATVAATGQEKYQKPYRPLLEKFVHIEAEDIDALKQAVNAALPPAAHQFRAFCF